MNASGPVGVFDSGIGGLTVAHAIERLLPAESLLYLGDTARVPYGPKSPETVVRYSLEILDCLLSGGVKAVVVACNTATAHALTRLREVSPVPVIGVIEPGAAAALRATRNGRIGVIGTAGTIASGAYPAVLRAMQPAVEVIDRACPLFVPLVEEGWLTHPATRMIAAEYLAPMQAAGIDTLVLGCTHYPLLKPLLADVLGPEVTLIDSAEETAAELAGVLEERGVSAPAGSRAASRWAVTDDVARFAMVGAVFTGHRLEDIGLADLAAIRPAG